jgi:hypothetical protein
MSPSTSRNKQILIIYYLPTQGTTVCPVQASFQGNFEILDGPGLNGMALAPGDGRGPATVAQSFPFR